MSRAFVNEERVEERPEARPRGGGLPPGTPNLVTPWSAKAHEQELGGLRAERARLADATSGVDLARLAEVDAEIRELEAYLPTLQVIEPPAAPDRVAFATRVRIEGSGGKRTVDVVGVDEADPAHGRISFLAPLARALLGAAVGDTVTARTPSGDEEWEVTRIGPAQPPR
jgi:transcription elongation factor GreB